MNPSSFSEIVPSSDLQKGIMSEERAIKAKETIAFLKLPIQKQMAFLAKLGYNKQNVATGKNVKSFLREIIRRNN